MRKFSKRLKEQRSNLVDLARETGYALMNEIRRNKTMAITASMVKELREMTGAGMMDCKKALTETNGDMDAAVEFLRKNGQAKAEKKAGRIAAEGLVTLSLWMVTTAAAIVEVNSETDFVAKNDDIPGVCRSCCSSGCCI